MAKATLIIMAGGLGSRFGGLKQLARIGKHGEKIIDYSIFDAKRAGFDRVVFVIKEENLELFKSEIGDNVARNMQVDYVFQSAQKLPEGYTGIDGREKPLGTGHAVWCCKDVVKEPFAVINADDYYGPTAFKLVYDFLTERHEGINYCMAGFVLGNTLTDNGTVSRGVCEIDNNGRLRSVCEHKKLSRKGKRAQNENDDGSTKELDLNSVVSMNFWGFTPDFFDRLDAGLKEFLTTRHADPLRAEYFLPEAADRCIKDGYAKISVLTTNDKWYGVTYKEDSAQVSAAIAKLTDSGLYPEGLWD